MSHDIIVTIAIEVLPECVHVFVLGGGGGGWEGREGGRGRGRGSGGDNCLPGLIGQETIGKSRCHQNRNVNQPGRGWGIVTLLVHQEHLLLFYAYKFTCRVSGGILCTCVHVMYPVGTLVH